ncbi:MAG: DUF4405 domain-containing protein [Anaerolineae bacterium]|nr:DUF4405 domain-containing protein [Anaerolineae bacterium]
MKKSTFIIDIVSFVGFFILLMPDLTGLPIHEWFGLIIGAVLLVHLLQHRSWVFSVIRSFVHLKRIVRAKFLVDVLLGIGFSGILVTGFIISSILMLPLNQYDAWRTAHVSFSYITIVVLGYKIATHWDWLIKTMGRFFKPVASNGGINMDRRKFLRTCCITGLAAIFAVGEFREWSTKYSTLTDQSEDNDSDHDESSVVDDPRVVSQELTASLVSADEDTNEDQVVSILTAETLSPTSSEPALTITPTEEADTTEVVIPETGVVRCNKACSYPGRCRRYQDTVTKNNQCDLGEAIW